MLTEFAYFILLRWISHVENHVDNVENPCNVGKFEFAARGAMMNLIVHRGCQK